MQNTFTRQGAQRNSVLSIAIKNGQDTFKIEKLVARTTKPIYDMYGNTPLFYALEGKLSNSLIEKILRVDTVNYSNTNKITPLIMAIQTKTDFSIIKKIVYLQKFPYMHNVNELGESVVDILFLSKHPDLEKIWNLISGYGISCKNENLQLISKDSTFKNSSFVKTYINGRKKAILQMILNDKMFDNIYVGDNTWMGDYVIKEVPNLLLNKKNNNDDLQFMDIVYFDTLVHRIAGVFKIHPFEILYKLDMTILHKPVVENAVHKNIFDNLTDNATFSLKILENILEQFDSYKWTHTKFNHLIKLIKKHSPKSNLIQNSLHIALNLTYTGASFIDFMNVFKTNSQIKVDDVLVDKIINKIGNFILTEDVMLNIFINSNVHVDKINVLADKTQFVQYITLVKYCEKYNDQKLFMSLIGKLQNQLNNTDFLALVDMILLKPDHFDQTILDALVSHTSDIDLHDYLVKIYPTVLTARDKQNDLIEQIIKSMTSTLENKIKHFAQICMLIVQINYDFEKESESIQNVINTVFSEDTDEAHIHTFINNFTNFISNNIMEKNFETEIFPVHLKYINFIKQCLSKSNKKWYDYFCANLGYNMLNWCLQSDLYYDMTNTHFSTMTIDQITNKYKFYVLDNENKQLNNKKRALYEYLMLTIQYQYNKLKYKPKFMKTKMCISFNSYLKSMFVQLNRDHILGITVDMKINDGISEENISYIVGMMDDPIRKFYTNNENIYTFNIISSKTNIVDIAQTVPEYKWTSVWNVDFQGQPGFNAGGITKEIFYLLGKNIDAQYMKSIDGYSMIDVLKCKSVNEYKKIYKNIGKFVGKSIFVDKRIPSINLHPYILYKLKNYELFKNNPGKFFKNAFTDQDKNKYGELRNLNSYKSLIKMSDYEFDEYSKYIDDEPKEVDVDDIENDIDDNDDDIDDNIDDNIYDEAKKEYLSKDTFYVGAKKVVEKFFPNNDSDLDSNSDSEIEIGSDYEDIPINKKNTSTNECEIDADIESESESETKNEKTEFRTKTTIKQMMEMLDTENQPYLDVMIEGILQYDTRHILKYMPVDQISKYLIESDTYEIYGKQESSLESTIVIDDTWRASFLEAINTLYTTDLVMFKKFMGYWFGTPAFNGFHKLNPHPVVYIIGNNNIPACYSHTCNGQLDIPRPSEPLESDKKTEYLYRLFCNSVTNQDIAQENNMHTQMA